MNNTTNTAPKATRPTVATCAACKGPAKTYKNKKFCASLRCA